MHNDTERCHELDKYVIPEDEKVRVIDKFKIVLGPGNLGQAEPAIMTSEVSGDN